MSRTPEENLRFKRDLERRTQKFSVDVFRCLDFLPVRNSSKVISYQLGAEGMHGTAEDFSGRQSKYEGA